MLHELNGSLAQGSTSSFDHEKRFSTQAVTHNVLTAGLARSARRIGYIYIYMNCHYPEASAETGSRRSPQTGRNLDYLGGRLRLRRSQHPHMENATH